MHAALITIQTPENEHSIYNFFPYATLLAKEGTISQVDIIVLLFTTDVQNAPHHLHQAEFDRGEVSNLSPEIRYLRMYNEFYSKVQEEQTNKIKYLNQFIDNIVDWYLVHKQKPNIWEGEGEEGGYVAHLTSALFRGIFCWSYPILGIANPITELEMLSLFCSDLIIVPDNNTKQLFKQKYINTSQFHDKVLVRSIDNGIMEVVEHVNSKMKRDVTNVRNEREKQIYSKLRKKLEEEKQDMKINQLLISDFDDTLFHQKESHLFPSRLNYLSTLLTNRSSSQKNYYKIIINTGRTLENLQNTLSQTVNVRFHVIITSVGTEIWFYDKVSNSYTLDENYRKFINFQWKRAEIRSLIANNFKELTEQPKANQGEFKLSYYIEDRLKHDLHYFKVLQAFCYENHLNAKIIRSKNCVDFLPVRSGKLNAARFLCKKLNLCLSSIYTSGDSMNDVELLYGNSQSILVANCDWELRKNLFHFNRVYFASEPHILGVCQGIQHWLKNPS